jgi:pyruvate kinase
MGLIGGSLPDPNMSQVQISCTFRCIPCSASAASRAPQVAWAHIDAAVLSCMPQVEALASSAVRAADKLHAALLIVFTSTGRTARIVAK